MLGKIVGITVSLAIAGALPSKRSRHCEDEWVSKLPLRLQNAKNRSIAKYAELLLGEVAK